AAMADANGRDLAQFGRWYAQAGTPVLDVSDDYDAETRRYTLTVRQSCPPTPGQPDKQPFHIPLRMGLLDDSGRPLPLRLAGESERAGTDGVLEWPEPGRSSVLEDLPARRLPPLLRGFSARCS